MSSKLILAINCFQAQAFTWKPVSEFQLYLHFENQSPLLYSPVATDEGRAIPQQNLRSPMHWLKSIFHRLIISESCNVFNNGAQKASLSSVQEERCTRNHVHDIQAKQEYSIRVIAVMKASKQKMKIWNNPESIPYMSRANDYVEYG